MNKKMIMIYWISGSFVMQIALHMRIILLEDAGLYGEFKAPTE